MFAYGYTLEWPQQSFDFCTEALWNLHLHLLQHLPCISNPIQLSQEINQENVIHSIWSAAYSPHLVIQSLVPSPVCHHSVHMDHRIVSYFTFLNPAFPRTSFASSVNPDPNNSDHTQPARSARPTPFPNSCLLYAWHRSRWDMDDWTR